MKTIIGLYVYNILCAWIITGLFHFYSYEWWMFPAYLTFVFVSVIIMTIIMSKNDVER